MTQLGLDYSYARPTPAQLKAAGVVGVGRYLATDRRGLSASEFKSYQAEGIGLWLVYEGVFTGMLNGEAQGVSDAHAALSRIAALGLPSDSPVYWAADFDIAPGSAEIAKADAYVIGWNSVIPPGRRGGYGGLWYLKHVGADIDFRWECGSTRFRHGVTESEIELDLQQTTQAPPVANTDHNNVFKTGSFVIQNGEDMPLSADDLTNISKTVIAALSSDDFQLDKTHRASLTEDALAVVLAGNSSYISKAQLAALFGTTSITTAVNAAVSKMNVTVDAEALASAIVAHLSLVEK